jgi:AAA+ superfamily predicted ATPase
MPMEQAEAFGVHRREKPRQDMSKDLEALIASNYPIVIIKTFDEEKALQEVRKAAWNLKLPLLCWSVTKGLHLDTNTNSVYNTKRAQEALAHITAADIDAVYFLEDFQPYLEDPAVQRMLRELAYDRRHSRPTVILCGPDLAMPKSLEKDVIEYQLRPPTKKELDKLLRDSYQEAEKTRKIKVTLTESQWNQLVSHLEGFTFREAQRIITMLLQDGRLGPDDIETVIQHKKKLVLHSGILEIISTPPSLDDIAGLARLKEWLMKRACPFSAEAQKLGLTPPKGVLLLGVQGCGKSLSAKAVATAWSAPLVRLDPASLFDKYIGESEKNLKKAIEQAELLAPVVLWIDEIEKLLEATADSEADGGLSRRLLGMFLSWMQEKQKPVFVAATSNDISRLPPELLRKGRFDEIFFIDLPQRDVRIRIFRIHLVKRNHDPKAFDLVRLADAAEGFSGAEIEQVIIDSLYEVLAGKALSTELLLAQIANTRPLSVVMAEKVEALRQWAAERTVPAE